MKVYRGNPAAARSYVEADRGRVDDYYLAEGTGLAQRLAASPATGIEPASVVRLADMDGDAYEAWVAGLDPDTGAPRGRLRTDDSAVRFVEVVVNGPKTWSLAATLHPEVAAAYDAAMDSAAEQIVGWLSEHATTRVGPRGRQVQVGVEQLEAAVVRHYTSRAGDPHRHLHLQINARVFADRRWRGLHTVGVRDSLAALNGIGHAAVATDPRFRTSLAERGLTLDPATGEVSQLAGYVGAFSSRARQIGATIDRYEADWRAAHPDTEPGPALRRSWDARAWAEARPDKVVPTDGDAMVQRWRDELTDLGYTPPPAPTVADRRLPSTGYPPLETGTPRVPSPTDTAGTAGTAESPRVGQLDRAAAVDTVLARLGARRSAWNSADIRGEVEQWIARTGLVVDKITRLELAEDLTARAVGACVPLLGRDYVPAHVRALTSPAVLAVEADILARLAHRNNTQPDHQPDHQPDQPPDQSPPVVPAGFEDLDPGQRRGLALLTGTAPLVVIEGAAGTGKTSALTSTRIALARTSRRLVVTTPTLKAAQVVTEETGAPAYSAAWLAHHYGWRWDDDGRWTHHPDHDQEQPQPGRGTLPLLRPGDLLVVDEAGMLDQDTARALLTIADQTGARLALIGDRHQLPAVGRGGVLDHATRWTTPGTTWTDLDTVHRFTDPNYATLTLAMRTGTWPNNSSPAAAARPERAPSEPAGDVSAAVFDQLWDRGQIHLHATEAERTQSLAAQAATDHLHGKGNDAVVMASTRDQVADLNAAIRDRLVATGHVHGRVQDDGPHQPTVTTRAGQQLGVGDRVATRRNDAGLGVANRDTWTITAIDEDGALTLARNTQAKTQGQRTVPRTYAIAHVELAYATTVHGAQGQTSGTAHVALDETATAASAYVAMTRGREHNTAHLIAETRDQARAQWTSIFARDPADLGPAHAADRAEQVIDRYGPTAPPRSAHAEPARRPAGVRRPPDEHRLPHGDPRGPSVSR
ncbi:MobF family relaxase [Marmoricola endophyticus]|uniref:MobF family relaxase n=1 Tax=Marmoricola endophyticus TaxID=2040280 RepID=UPI001E5C71AF|nr:MobF family relaxase [Marmoricola endophyticus]